MARPWAIPLPCPRWRQEALKLQRKDSPRLPGLRGTGTAEAWTPQALPLKAHDCWSHPELPPLTTGLLIEMYEKQLRVIGIN